MFGRCDGLWSRYGLGARGVWLRGSVAVRWQTLKRGKTAKIAKAVQDEEEDVEEDDDEVMGQRAAGKDGGGESQITAEANAIKSEALQEKQLQQQQRVSEVFLPPRGAMLVFPHSCPAMAPLGAIKRWHATKDTKRWHAPRYLLRYLLQCTPLPLTWVLCILVACSRFLGHASCRPHATHPWS